jgi:hypothetical protein
LLEIGFLDLLFALCGARLGKEDFYY